MRDVVAGNAVAARAGSEVHGEDVAESVFRLLVDAPEAVAGRMFNCSDIVVSTRDIAALVQRLAGVSGPLPEEAPPPRGVMRSDALKALGVEFGGRKKFKDTVQALVAAVQERL